MSMTEINGHRRAPSRQKRPRSAVTSGRELFIGGDSKSAWSRRYHDLVVGYINDLSAGEGPNALSEGTLGLIQHTASIKCELERLDAMRSRSEPVDMNCYASQTGHYRRNLETLYGTVLERRQRDITSSCDDVISDYEKEVALNEHAAITD
jgi:hypothetical protein